MRTITESKTTVNNSFHGWSAETLTTVKGQTFKVTTMKRHSGQLTTSALPVTAEENNGMQIISFDSAAIFNKNKTLISVKVPRITEKAVRAQHAEGLILFDRYAEEIQPEEVQTPVIGTILFMDGYGKGKGCEGNNHIIYQIDNGNFGTTYKTVDPDTLVLSVKDYVKPYSEKFGIGIYFDPAYKFKGTQEDLNNLVIDAHQATKARAAQKVIDDAAAKVTEAAAIEALKKEYKHLTPVKDSYDNNAIKSNLVTELKKNFPGIKFSVTKSNYSTYRVNWIDGPTTREVRETTDKFVSYENDQTGDYRDHAPSLFNDVFGGFKYIFTGRDLSPEIEALREDFYSLLNFREKPGDYDQFFYRFTNKESIPAGAKVKGIKRVEDWTGGHIEDAYYFEIEEAAQPEPIQAVNAEGIQVIDYSEKAIAVIGETKPYKDLLKSLGGRFNFRLTCGAGWIFKKSQEEEVKAALSL